MMNSYEKFKNSTFKEIFDSEKQSIIIKKDNTFSFMIDYELVKAGQESQRSFSFDRVAFYYNPDRKDLYRHYLEYKKSWNNEDFHQIENKTVEEVLKEQVPDIEKWLKDKLEKAYNNYLYHTQSFEKTTTIVTDILEKGIL